MGPARLSVLLFLVPALLSAQAAPPIRGFSPVAAAAQARLEATMAGLLSRDSTGAWFREFTRLPHPAASERNRQLAELIASAWKAYGLEDVRLRRYEVLMPWPEQVRVTMTAPSAHQARLTEDCYPEDRDACVGPELTYLGMSGSGDVTGELVYANSGNPADYDWLEAQGVDLKGKIAIVRYSNPYSYRGFKALTAEQRGLRAMLIYSDPQEDGYRRGLTFPNGPWGPESHIQRGAISYDFIVPGDPLTPGWASGEGARRIPEAEARSIPKIIAVPLSARDAEPMLRALAGPVAPSAWQGALPFTYRVGPGATVQVTVKMDGKTRPIWVTEGRIRGSETPDQTVVLGNHRDAWVYGAVDPSSGSATQMELARALGRLVKDGRRPKRTIVFTSWDAEEWHLTGSTEWGEEFAKELQAGAVAYLNVDGSTSGAEFNASAVATLNRLVQEVARDVADPATGKSLLEVTTARVGADGVVDNKLGSGSDYTVFLNFLGIPIVDLSFGGPYGVYHSQYDNYTWMSRFGDPGFRYMTAMAEVWGRMALRLANAEILPYDLTAIAWRLGQFLEELAALPGVRERLDLADVTAAQRAMHEAAEGLEASLRRGGAAPQMVNAAMQRLEQQWLLADGIPGRPWFRHALYAPKYTYAALELPGVREAVDAGDWGAARREAARLAERIRAMTAAITVLR
ncbi:MAG TPA: M28 family metallopeptidase [Gemmatimonadales bacterium]